MPVNVLLLAHSLGEGGSERQLAQTAKRLARDRFQPHVASVAGGFNESILRQAAVPVWRLPLRSFADWSAVESARQLRDYVQRNRIQLVHPFDFTLTVFAVPTARTCPGVVALASQRCFLELVPTKYRLPLRAALRLADGVVVNSRALREHLLCERAARPERIHVCPNGVDTEAFRPHRRQRLPELREASVVIGTVSVLRPEKNLGLLLEAFAQLAPDYPNARLLIAGDGPERRPLQERAKALGIAKRTVFHPRTPDVAPVLASIDIFVCSSLTEGLPNAVMEAMACGCCVVASAVGGCPELVTHEKTGLLFRSNDLEDLVGQLRRAIAEEPLRQATSQAAAAFIQQHYSLEKAVRQMEQIYEEHLLRRDRNSA
ncbi:MAG: glycosyltransferase [Bryobacterales bacterium]|nr:glycosyltransferase [Bryobacteraceae bacterium]MDW8355424.1 glycosyltransferase [Bryobacterales bacterium]